MAASGGTAVRRVGRVLTGFGALVVLIGLLVGGPIALLAFAGNPLPDHVPTLAEIGTTLTSRDDGQLFLRALAIVGWFGWASFALSVLVELGAQSLRRPAPRLPGMGRQQRAAAALVGSVALIIAASPAATAATTAYTAPAYSAPAAATATLAGPPTAYEPVSSGTERATADAPVYKVAKGDYLGKVADRYLDDFEDYRELAALNKLRDPDRIRPGQLITLPANADDQGARPHATGRLVGAQARPAPEQSRPTPSKPTPSKPDVEQPESAAPTPPSPAATPQGRPAPHDEAPEGHPPVVTVGAARAGEPDRVNRPLAISAVLAVASIVGAQIGAVLGLRRRPVPVAATRQPVRSGPPAELPVGRHRKD
ncbi:LysM domain-containing protein [Micromonospora sp. NPDC047793]|uniref:LysM peptidoglycan-binding domain-containing protein n=1 Tax=unclassified Micromonospora TaxID=2617518 RepID=UPI00103414FA|nr:LysM domain-containing protein [Verrucosispora sp. SN26_14.1]TBL31841.1 LysM domain-containing protein [Verrucosispora sp. SN26_14.1]